MNTRGSIDNDKEVNEALEKIRPELQYVLWAGHGTVVINVADHRAVSVHPEATRKLV